MTLETTEKAPMLVLPDVIGLRLEDATALIRQAGFPNPTWKYTETYDQPGTVVNTAPLPNTMIRADKPIQLSVSQQSLIRFLPTVYQEGRTEEEADFLTRFLWIAQHMYESVQMRADSVAQMLNPFQVDEEFLPWLSSWVAMTMDEDWDTDKKRKFLSRVSDLYTIRGTRRALGEMIEVFTGVKPRIQENEWPYEGFRIGVHSTMGTESIMLPEMNLAFCFVVHLPLSSDDLKPGMLSKIHDIIRNEKPAHTMYFLQFEGEQGVTVDHMVMPIGVGMRIGADAPMTG